MLIRLGHSPDPDDAFMFWGLASGEVDPRQFEFEHVLRDIQTLNKWALDGKLEVTAISLAAYPLVQERYVLLPHGASMGSGYGPIVVSSDELSTSDLRDVEIAVAGGDRVARPHHRGQPRRAEPVHRHTRNRVRQAREQRRHPGDVAVVLARLVRGAEVDVLDLARRYTGPLDGLGDREGRKVVRPLAREHTAVAPDGRPHRRENHRAAHEASLVFGF